MRTQQKKRVGHIERLENSIYKKIYMQYGTIANSYASSFQNYSKAIEYYNKQLDYTARAVPYFVNFANGRIFYNLGLCYEKLGEIDKTKKYFIDSVKSGYFKDTNKEILYKYVDKKDAEVYYKRALSLYPDVVTITISPPKNSNIDISDDIKFDFISEQYFKLINYLKEENKIKEAEEETVEILKFNPDYPTLKDKYEKIELSRQDANI